MLNMIKIVSVFVLIALLMLCSCDPGKVVKLDRPSSHNYAGKPPKDLSLRDYSRVIFGKFQVFEGVDAGNLPVDFPQAIYNKLNFYHPRAFDDVRLWQFDKPGLFVTGFIVECNSSGKSRRLSPNPTGTAVLGVEIVLQDNISGREITRFSYRYPYFRPNMTFEDLVNDVARDVAGFLADARKH